MKRALAGLLVAGLLAAGAAGLLFLRRQRQLAAFAAAPFGEATARVVDIPPGSGPRRVAELLAQARVVSSAEDFYAYLRQEGAGPRLKAGEYEFTGALTPGQVVELVASGRVRVYRFTVPEGLRVDEILPLLAASALRLSLPKLAALAQQPAFVRGLGVPADSLEGFLFPDTYTFARGATEEAVLRKMVERTLEEYRAADAARQPGITLSLLEAVTLASIVEKETGAPEERPRIACVFHNRLKKGWKLQTDPTVLYAMRLMRGVWDKNIRKSDLTTPHPYNTYTRVGLPPGPIASPGAAALRAALAPLACEDLFFVSRNDGTHVFCPTLACHEEQVRRWQVEAFRTRHAP